MEKLFPTTSKMKITTKKNNFPEYINFLLNPDLPLDYHITVGTSKERFGVVKWMLIARSKQLRSHMYESVFKNDKELDLPDLEPVAFKNFLVYSYGHDHISTLPFEELVSLLTVAELYDVQDLKTRLSDTIIPQLTTDNVFVALKNGPICDRVPELWETITEMIQSETEKLFSNPEFRTASKEVMLHIVQQDHLCAPEIEVWKAALEWARYQGEPVEQVVSAQTLRKTLLPMLKHIRLCSLTHTQLVNEVFTTGVLSGEEMTYVSISVKEKKICDELVEICNEIEDRKEPANLDVIDLAGEVFNIPLFRMESSITITPNACDVKLCSAAFLAIPEAASVENVRYNCVGKIKITAGTTATRTIGEIEFQTQVQYGEVFFVRLNYIHLKANRNYTMSFSFFGNHKVLTKTSCIQDLAGRVDNLTVQLQHLTSPNTTWNTYYGSHLKTLKFKVLRNQQHRKKRRS